MSLKRKAFSKGPITSKKRRRDQGSAVEEITWNGASREDYLTGFHKRKLQRIKHAQEEAAKKEREQKIAARKNVRQPLPRDGSFTFELQAMLTYFASPQLRDERKADLERHVQAVNAVSWGDRGEVDSTGSTDDDTGGEDEDRVWDGFQEERPVNREDEYVDEDRFTTVTVEAVDVSKDGMRAVDTAGEEMSDVDDSLKSGLGTLSRKDVADPAAGGRTTRSDAQSTSKSRNKKKKVKFRYESKGERKATRMKEKLGKKAKAKARRG